MNERRLLDSPRLNLDPEFKAGVVRFAERLKMSPDEVLRTALKFQKMVDRQRTDPDFQEDLKQVDDQGLTPKPNA